MRRLMLVLGLLMLAPGAFADEFEIPVLRGSSPFVPAAPKYTGWSGFYAGGQIGYGWGSFDFSRATQSLVAFALRETALEEGAHPSQWQVLGNASSGGGAFGAFAGFNSQWDDLILGIDVNYSRTSFGADAQLTPIGRQVASGNLFDVFVTGNASMTITDIGTARVRAGYVMNNVVPFGTFGMAVGRANISRSATVFGIQNSDSPANAFPFSFSASETKNGTFIYGYSAGLGADILVMPNVFLRGEWEFVKFLETSGIRSQIQMLRAGAGLKF